MGFQHDPELAVLQVSVLHALTGPMQHSVASRCLEKLSRADALYVLAHRCSQKTPS